MPEVPAPKIVPLSQSGFSPSEGFKPASFQASKPAITPYIIPVELKLRSSKSVKYWCKFFLSMGGVPET